MTAMRLEALEARFLCSAAPAVQAGYNSAGLSSISYNGLKLFDSTVDAGFDLFNYSWQSTNGTQGSAKNPQTSSSWNAATQVLTTTAPNILITTQYITSGATFTLRMTVTNTSSVNTLLGADVYPLCVQFPQQPVGFNGTPRMQFGIDGPTVIDADFGSGSLIITNDKNRGALYVGLEGGWTTATSFVYPLTIGSMPLDNQPASWPMLNRNLRPGKSEAYTVSLRLAASGADPAVVAAPVYAQFAAAHPTTLQWTDKRPIAALYLSGAAPDIHSPTNPRGYLFDPTVDVTTPAGLADFRARLLAYADQSTAIMKSMNSQGMITWDLEGEQFMLADYIGDPTQLAALAPEMDYAPPGQLATVDAYFKKFADAGFKTGLTIRPTTLAQAGGTYQQVSSIDPAQTMLDKIIYAENRWGCKIFYLDSTDAFTSGGALLVRLQKALPGVLLIPENSDTASYAYGVPYFDPRNSDTATPPAALATYPGSFNLFNAMDADLTVYGAQLLQAVQRGSILLFRGWNYNPQNPKIASIYAQAGVTPAFAASNGNDIQSSLNATDPMKSLGKHRAVTAASPVLR